MPAKKSNTDHDKTVIKNVIDLVGKGNSHASLDDALDAIPFFSLGERPSGLPYSIWQLTEHIRIANGIYWNFHEMQNIFHQNGLMNIGRKNYRQIQRPNGKNVFIK